MAQLTKEQLREAQIERAMANGASETKHQLLAVAGYFDVESQKIVIEFESGVEYRFPYKLGQGLENASEAELSNIFISPSGRGIHWPDIDVGFSVDHLLQGVYGTTEWMKSIENCNSDIVTVRHGIHEGLHYWKHNKALSNQLREEIANANVLFTPLKPHQYTVGDLKSKSIFPPDAESFYSYIRDAQKRELQVDMCVDDGEYRTLALYSEPISLTVLGTIVISSVIAPIIKDLLLEYIRKNRSEVRTDSELRFTLIIDNEKGLTQEINYSGPSSELEKILPNIIDTPLTQAKPNNIAEISGHTSQNSEMEAE